MNMEDDQDIILELVKYGPAEYHQEVFRFFNNLVLNEETEKS